MSNQYIKDNAINTGLIDGHKYWIHPGAGFGGMNGYIVFEKKPVREDSYNGILTYVPVHGGITYCSHDPYGSVYGFDTAHCDSNNFPIHNIKWIKKQISVMLEGIKRATKVEAKYLRCISNKGKAKHCEYVQKAGESEQRLNFGVSINLLSGQL